VKILYFSPISWRWIKQRPHFTAELLADSGDEVEFLSCTPLGKGRRAHWKERNLTIRERLLLPFSLRVPPVGRVNAWWARRVFFAGEKFDRIILTDPRQLPFLPARLRRQTPLIYDCMDMLPFFHPDPIRRRLIRAEEELCRAADAVIASSHYIGEHLRQAYRLDPAKVTVIHNAVPGDFLDSPVSTPAPARRSGRPLLLYLGTIDSWLDWETLADYAERRSQTDIELIGPRRNTPQRLPENIRFRDAVAHREVLACLNRADVLLLPFRINELIRGVDPVKMYEYLATGKPVLSAYWEELESFRSRPQLHFYRTSEEFTALVDSLVDSPPAEPAPEFVRSNCWEERIRLYQSVLERLPERKKS